MAERSEAADVLEVLYAAGPEEFIAERKRIERQLRETGRSAEADDIAARKKPPVPVFAANRLARESPDDVAALIAAAERLTGAHEAGDPGALRKEQAELAKRVSGLVRKAGLSEPMAQRFALLLRTAASDPETVAALRRGVLSEELEPEAFGALAGITLPPPKERPKPARAADRAREEKQREGVKELERELADAKADLKRAERRVAQLTKQLDDARRAV